MNTSATSMPTAVRSSNTCCACADVPVTVSPERLLCSATASSVSSGIVFTTLSTTSSSTYSVGE
jgi:hypothetical protein